MDTVAVVLILMAATLVALPLIRLRWPGVGRPAAAPERRAAIRAQLAEHERLEDERRARARHRHA